MPEASANWNGWCPVLATSLAAAHYERELTEPLKGLWDKLAVVRVLPPEQLIEFIAAADLEASIDRAHRELHKIPLVLEDAESCIASRFLKLKDVVSINCAELAAAAEAKCGYQRLVEEARVRLVRAMPVGKIVQLQCDGSALHPALSAPNGLPKQLWHHDQITSTECCESLVQDGDLDSASNGAADYAVGQSGVFFIADSFRVVLTSSLGPFSPVASCDWSNPYMQVWTSTEVCWRRAFHYTTST